MTVADRIRHILTRELSPTRLEVIDDSARHQGHAGADPAGESHFSATIVSDHFAGQSRVARHRLVYGLLSAEMATRIHALQLRTLTPAEETAAGASSSS